MAGQVVPGTVRVEMRYTIPNNTCENVFHVKRGSTVWTEAQIDALEAAFRSWFTDTAAEFLSNQLSLYEILITDLTSLAGIRKSYQVSPALVGNISSGYLPANVTIAVKASIGLRGRGTNGRVYWPALCASQVSDQIITSSATTDIVGALNTLISDVAALGGGEALVIPHFKVANARPPTVTTSPVQNYLVSDP